MYCGVIKIPYTSSSDFVDILPLGDLHLGNSLCEFGEFKKTVERLGDDNTYGILMGDMIDAIIAADNRFDPHVTQLGDLLIDYSDELVDLLSPYSDRILGVLIGNHEDKLRKKAQIDVSHYIAKRLNVPYWGFSALMYIIFRRERHSESLRLFATHGSFNGRTRSGRITRVEQLSEIVDADLYVCAHMHDLLSTEDVVFTVNRAGKRVVKTRTYVVSGGYLGGYADGNTFSYVEAKLLKPLKIGTPTIRIYPEQKKKVVVTLP